MSGTASAGRSRVRVAVVLAVIVVLLGTSLAAALTLTSGAPPSAATSSVSPTASASPLGFGAAPSPTYSAPTPAGAPPGLATPPSSEIAAKLVPLDLPGPRPASWGSTATPPGEPFAISRGAAVGEPLSAGGPSGSEPCYAVETSQPLLATLPLSCVAHDEPTLSFYSVAPGSGGNVSWSLTLPVDTSSTANQSDLYAAAWAGFVASDPAAWLGQCYVEVQLYPDFSWNTPTTTVPGVWSAAVVGWQIDPASGDVNTCYYSPLYLNGLAGDGYFAMAQGDALSLSLVGWAGSTVGENVTLTDTSSGQSSWTILYNETGGFPLNPAFASNQFTDALLFSTGGQASLSFGFEIGRAGNLAVVHNNTFGGCSPGPGIPTMANPAVPCPSYDPVSWVNDTLLPWQINVPEFTTASGSTTPAQMEFSSSVGGAAALPAMSADTCLNRIGSAFCQYPWFGYSCTDTAFTFGAVDYAIESNDFGEGYEYAPTASISPLGLPQFPAMDYAVPTCGGTSYTVTTGVSGTPGGAVEFLSHTYTGASGVSGIGPGTYSISALPPVGAGFGGWTVSGGLSVASASSPYTTLTVSGSGTISAAFTTGPPMVAVTFASSTSGSAVIVTPGFTNSNGTGSTVKAGGTLALAPGVYSIQAAPPSGSAFVRWSVTAGASGGTIASAESPVTWLVVTGNQLSVTVTAVYATSSALVTVELTGFGNGSVTLGGHTFPYNPVTGYSQGNVTLGVGTYAATAVAAPGWTFLGWNFTPAAYLIDYNASTNVSFGGSVGTLTALFAANVATFNFAITDAGGRIAFNGVGPLSNGTIVRLLRGTYSLDALPFGYNTFVRWNVSDPAALWVFKPTYALTHVMVNSTGTVTATFGPAANVTATFDNSPANAGSITFNYQTYTGASTVNDSLANGSFLIRANPAVGYVLFDWSLSGPVSIASGILTVAGRGGVITAHFISLGYPVSFVTGGSANAKANLSGQLLANGDAVGLGAGTYPLSAVIGPHVTFLRWIPTGSISVPSRTATNTTLTVSGAGTLFAVVDAFSLIGVNSSKSIGEVGRPVTFTAVYQGTPPRSFSWAGLPSGCGGRDSATVPCTPAAAGGFSVTVTVAGANGVPVVSSPLPFSVNGALTLTSFTSTKTVLDLGMSTTITSNVLGGTSPINYTYLHVPSGCTSGNAPSFVCQPAAVGTSTIEVTVSDVLGASVSGNLTLVVAPALTSATLAANRTEMTVSVPFNLTTRVGGGSQPLTYQYFGLPAFCFSADLSVLNCTPSVAAPYTINVTVTDAAGAQVKSSVSVLVNPRPSISSFNATPGELLIGSTLTLTIVAHGGTGPLSYAVAGLPTGCSSENLTTFTCNPNATGNFTLLATVTDSDGVASAPFPQIVTVLSQPAPSSSSTPGGLSWWVWAVIAAVIAAALIVGYLLLRRKPARPKTPPPKPPEGNPR